MPLISIIIPVYNVEKYLSRCLDSILSQTFTNFEVVLVDDGSTDSSGDICDEYERCDNRIKVHHKKNGGVSSARNMGLDNAVGEWITFVDADDWVDRDIYNRLYNAALQSQAEIVLCDFYLYYNKDRIELCKAISTDNKKDDIIRNYILSFTALWNMLVHRSLYDKTHLRIPQYLSNCEDFWISIRLFYYAKKIFTLHVPLYFYNRENVNSILNNPNKGIYRSEYLSYLDTISFFKKENVLDLYEKQLSWRVLKCKQDMILDVKEHHKFLEIYPASHRYILTCPPSFCNMKIKILMWLLIHKLRWLVIIACKIRTLVGKNSFN